MTNDQQHGKNMAEELLDLLVCPENLSKLHIADAEALLAVNERIARGDITRWDGARRMEAVAKLLVREDCKVAYEIKEGIPVMLIDEALVLDPSVGKPNPARGVLAR